MVILAIETSCDETAISIVEASGDISSASFRVLGNELYSQAEKHQEYGGVYPNLAKREHAKNLPILLRKVLVEAATEGLGASDFELDEVAAEEMKVILIREPEMYTQLVRLLNSVGKQNIDYIAVTNGPGLEPALWVGITFAQALGKAWDVPVLPVNHMEGHIIASLMRRGEDNVFSLADTMMPALALLISGGHTELILIKNWAEYEIIGETKDDAVGEAFDKVARMLGLPYPGGPEISRLATHARSHNLIIDEKLPRPMMGSDNLDFSFSGLKTAVLYRIRGKQLSNEYVKKIAREFEDAVTDVLLSKSERAIEKHKVQSFVIGGGVSANNHIRTEFMASFSKSFPQMNLHLPEKNLATDNAIMIAAAGYLHAREVKSATPQITANGNLRL